MTAVLDKLLAAKRASGKERAALVKELADGSPLPMGENNFYSLADINTYAVDIRVEMQA